MALGPGGLWLPEQRFIPHDLRMNLSEELAKLQSLHWNGALTDEEFTRAKDRLLAKDGAAASPAVSLRLELEAELERIDREWNMERENYLVSGKHGTRHVPSKTGSIVGGIFVTMFSLFWITMAVGITGVMPNEGPFSVAKVAFPLFGLCFLGFAIAAVMKGYSKADQMEVGEKAWQQRRAEVEARLKALGEGKE